MNYRIKFYDKIGKKLVGIHSGSIITPSMFNKWQKAEKIKMCEIGYHCCKQNFNSLVEWAYGDVIALVEMRGKKISEAYKECWEEQRIVVYMANDCLNDILSTRLKAKTSKYYYLAMVLPDYKKRTKISNGDFYKLILDILKSKARKSR